MGQWIEHLGRMYQIRMADDHEYASRYLADREYTSSIERRRGQRRRNWIDPDPSSERQFRRKQIRRKNELHNR